MTIQAESTFYSEWNTDETGLASNNPIRSVFERLQEFLAELMTNRTFSGDDRTENYVASGRETLSFSDPMTWYEFSLTADVLKSIYVGLEDEFSLLESSLRASEYQLKMFEARLRILEEQIQPVLRPENQQAMNILAAWLESGEEREDEWWDEVEREITEQAFRI